MITVITCPICRGLGELTSLTVSATSRLSWETHICPACKGDGELLSSQLTAYRAAVRREIDAIMEDSK